MGGSDKGNDHPCQSGQEVGEPEKDLQAPVHTADQAEITIADADVVQDGATGSHLDCKDRARACHGALF
uniref:Uncharacterized protein n=1 Tax=Knipowitschia caucasica TaxID=637954 RepID=A0AAV2M3Q3_KNICA